MTRRGVVVTVGLLGAAAVGILSAQSPSSAPDWAYGYMVPVAPTTQVAPPCPPTKKAFECAYPAPPLVEDGVKNTLPDTPISLTRYETYWDYGPGDWYPGDHPTMPPIVAKGKQDQQVRACALCHYPNGQGKMENGGVAGLPAGYILQQLEAFKNGDRRSSDPRKANANEMIRIASSLTPEEAKAAADYFSSMPWRPWTRVVESETAPTVRATINGLLLPVAGQPTQPLGNRIIETPENPESTDVTRNPRSGFVAYAPMGSIAKGKEIAATGGGKTLQCSICHGPELKGVGNVPGIAGRTTSYTMRQLWDIKQGTRKSQMMTPVVANLTMDDMLSLTAYVSSLKP